MKTSVKDRNPSFHGESFARSLAAGYWTRENSFTSRCDCPDWSAARPRSRHRDIGVDKWPLVFTRRDMDNDGNLKP